MSDIARCLFDASSTSIWLFGSYIGVTYYARFFTDWAAVILAAKRREQDDAMMVAFNAQQEEEDGRSSQWGGSVPGRRYIRRHREESHTLLHEQYFANPCMYTPDMFRSRFRMHRPLCERIMRDVANHNNYFIQRDDALGRPGFSTTQKVLCAIRQLAYGTVADLFDDTWAIAESTSIEILKKFTRSIYEVYGEEYLRRPNAGDLHRLLAKAEERGFPGMIGSLDCMHWRWNACPKAWEGQFTGYKGRATIILEAVASYDTWIWHAFFGLPGSLNDLNVLAKSPLFDDVLLGKSADVDYVVNGTHYGRGYYLVDGIYPEWATFVKTISNPGTPPQQYFARMQEAFRKDVERAFGILQARWAIVRGPARGWDREDLYYIMMACVILHNMIVEDEREEDETVPIDLNETPTRPTKAQIYDRSPTMETDVQRDEIRDLQGFMARYQGVKCKVISKALKRDLIQHLWMKKMQEEE